MQIPDNFLKGEIPQQLLCRKYDEECVGCPDRSVK